MTRSSRLLLALSALALVPAYFFPLWSIRLEAPQYPEGIGMLIRANTITGVKPYDLRNINNLNHYIGMKSIEPDSIPELDIIPWVLGVLILTGLTAALLGRRWMLFTWFMALGVLAVAGMADFWWWQYDYGHDLNPQAAIKIPGMSYQPPLIGSKMILNFKAHSWPGLGGWGAVLAGLMAAVAFLRELRERKRTTPIGQVSPDTGLAGVSGSGPSAAVLLLLSALVAGGCGEKGPVPVTLGEDSCSHCLMSIVDERYATELITRTGKVHFFDSVECLAAFAAEFEASDIASAWVTDFHTPSRMIRVEEAFFLRSKDLRSPMGMNLTAFGSGIAPETVLNSFIGEILDWEGVLAFVKAEGPPGSGMGGGPPGSHGGHGSEIR